MLEGQILVLLNIKRLFDLWTSQSSWNSIDICSVSIAISLCILSAQKCDFNLEVLRFFPEIVWGKCSPNP